MARADSSMEKTPDQDESDLISTPEGICRSNRGFDCPYTPTSI